METYEIEGLKIEGLTKEQIEKRYDEFLSYALAVKNGQRIDRAGQMVYVPHGINFDELIYI